MARPSVGPWTRAYLGVAIGAATIMVLLLALLPRGFFSGDEGVKLIQTQSLVERGMRSDALIYPGERFDRDWRHFPLAPPFVVGEGKHRRSVYSPLFAALSAPGWLAGSYVGALVVPAAAAVACALLAMALARRAGHGPGRAAFLGACVFLFAPVAAYGATLTEHTLGVALSLAAFVLLERAPPRWFHLVSAGACLGIGAILRTEVLVLLPAVALFGALRWGIGRALVERLALVGLAAFVAFGGYVLRNLAVLGSWNPAVLANATAAHRTSFSDSLPMLLPGGVEQVAGLPVWSLLVAAVLIGGLAWLRGRWLALGWAVAVFVITFLWGWVCVLGASEVIAGRERAWTGVLAVTPLALLGVLGAGRSPRRPEGAAVLAALLFIALVFLTNLVKSAGGLQIGARHMMPAVPLLLLGVLPFVARSRSWWAIVAPLCAISLVASFAQLQSLARMKRYHADIAAQVFSKATPDIVTSFFWGGQVLAEGYADHRIYLSPDRNLLRRLRRARIETLVQALGGFQPKDLRGLGLSILDDQDQAAVVYHLSKPPVTK